jgi:hypothetical protein
MKIKKLSILFIIFAVTILAQPFTANAVVEWEKYDNNPVLQTGDPGDFDEGAVERPVVVKDSDTYKMWYMGKNSSGTWQIGYATSENGTGWTKDGANPVLQPRAGKWDSAHVQAPWVIMEGSADYKMWYTGTDNADDEVNNQIGYATSENGINWNGRRDSSVLKGEANDWDADGVYAATVIIDNDAPTDERYKMWYAGFNRTAETGGIGYATSQDGIIWDKYNDPDTGDAPYAASDPVISLGPSGSWDGDFICSPTVIKEESIYRMWYEGEEFDTPVGGERIGYAYSIDGINWRKYDGNPVIMEGQSGSFDEDGTFNPMVLKDGNTYKMWYGGDCDPGPCVTEIGYATSQAYPGDHLQINNMIAGSLQTPDGLYILTAFIPEGPSLLDINELMVTGPNGSNFSHTFSDWDIHNVMYHQFPVYKESMDTVSPGIYTFSVKANNGQSAQNTLDLTTSLIDVPQDGTTHLDRRVNDNTSEEVYAGTATPAFKWKPYVGDEYYYRVWIMDWKNRAVWWLSKPDIGTNTDGEGYMSATVTDGILKENTPYHWLVEVLDTNDVWSGHNRSRSSWYDFYTGTKSATDDFLDNSYGKAFFRSERSFRFGDRGFFAAFVHNLAPWDIDTTGDDAFLVDDPNNDPFYYFNPDNDAKTGDPFPFMYFGKVQGFPADGTYDFYVYEDGTSNNDTVAKSFTGDNTLPRVSKDEMQHEDVVGRIDNAYLPYTDPDLFWKSKGTNYKYRVMVIDWNNRRPVWASDLIDGAPEGNEMSVAVVPGDVLEEHSPYRWFVDVYDSDKNNRTRSQWLSFMTGTGSAEAVGDELAVDFKTLGIYVYNTGSWNRIYKGVDPEGLCSFGTYLAVDFGTAYGLYVYDAGAWTRVHKGVAIEKMTGFGDKLAVDFGTSYPIYEYNFATDTWTPIYKYSSPRDTIEALGDKLVVDFKTVGIYVYDAGIWNRIYKGVDPVNIVSFGDKLAIDFGTAYGLYVYEYDTDNWTRVYKGVAIEKMAEIDGDLAIDFGTAYGLYVYEFDTDNWTRVYKGVAIEKIAGFDGNLAVDFGTAYPIYEYDFDTNNWNSIYQYSSPRDELVPANVLD